MAVAVSLHRPLTGKVDNWSDDLVATRTTVFGSREVYDLTGGANPQLRADIATRWTDPDTDTGGNMGFGFSYFGKFSDTIGTPLTDFNQAGVAIPFVYVTTGTLPQTYAGLALKRLAGSSLYAIALVSSSAQLQITDYIYELDTREVHIEMVAYADIGVAGSATDLILDVMVNEVRVLRHTYLGTDINSAVSYVRPDFFNFGGELDWVAQVALTSSISYNNGASLVPVFADLQLGMSEFKPILTDNPLLDEITGSGGSGLQTPPSTFSGTWNPTGVAAETAIAYNSYITLHHTIAGPDNVFINQFDSIGTSANEQFLELVDTAPYTSIGYGELGSKTTADLLASTWTVQAANGIGYSIYSMGMLYAVDADPLVLLEDVLELLPGNQNPDPYVPLETILYFSTPAQRLRARNYTGVLNTFFGALQTTLTTLVDKGTPFIGSSLDASGFPITGVADGVADTDAVNWGQVKAALGIT